MPAAAQPSNALPVTDQGISAFVGASAGRHLESRAASPLSPVGWRQTIDAGITFDGGSVFAFELGLRAATTTPDAGVEGAYQDRAFGGFGGVAVQLVNRTNRSFVPTVRGGLGLMFTQKGPTAGPHLGLGIAWDLGAVRVLAEVVTHALIAPFAVDVGGRLSLIAGRF